MTNEVSNHANDICCGFAEPDGWVSMEELNAINETLRFWHRSMNTDCGVVALAWMDSAKVCAVAARLH